MVQESGVVFTYLSHIPTARILQRHISKGASIPTGIQEIVHCRPYKPLKSARKRLASCHKWIPPLDVPLRLLRTMHDICAPASLSASSVRRCSRRDRPIGEVKLCKNGCTPLRVSSCAARAPAVRREGDGCTTRPSRIIPDPTRRFGWNDGVGSAFELGSAITLGVRTLGIGLKLGICSSRSSDMRGLWWSVSENW